MKALRTSWALIATGLGLAVSGCTDNAGSGNQEPSAASQAAEIVPAGEPENIPGRPVAARFWAEIDPAASTIAYYPIHEGNRIYRNQVMSELKYTYGPNTATQQNTCTPASNCLPAVGDVRLWTDQTKVTYVSGSGQCYSNGGGCAAPAAPCGNSHTFCAPIQMVSNVTWGNTRGALPDVVIQVAQPGTVSNAVQGCVDNGSNQFGLCHNTGGNKVDSAFTDLVSPIPGNGSTNFGCSYCYGNSAAIPAPQAGLRNAVVSGLDPTLKGYNTDTMALVLTNDASLSVVITVRYATPSFDAPGSQMIIRNGPTVAQCATPGTSTVTLGGGGFGPPAACLAATPPTSCPVSASTAPAGVQVLFPKTGGGTVAGTIAVWSDTSFRVTVPASAASGQIQLITPQGSNATNDSLVLCSVSNSWRSLTSSITSVGAMGGAFGTTIVVAGGRSDPTTSAGAMSATKLFALPATAVGNGSVTTGSSLNSARWGAGYAMVAGKLYVVGGAASDGSTCLQDSEVLATANGSWSRVQNSGAAAVMLPVALCQPVAVALGNYLIVSGGSTFPYADPNLDFATSNLSQTYVLDTTALDSGWQTFSAPATFDPTDRFNQAGASAGSLAVIVGGSDFSPAPVSAVAKVLQVAGTPGFTSLAALPVALSLPAVASVSTSFYVFGGGTASEGTAAAVRTLYKTSNASPGAWTTLSPGGSTVSPRWGHVFVTATPGYVGATAKIYAIGGANDFVPVSSIDEYTP